MHSSLLLQETKSLDASRMQIVLLLRDTRMQQKQTLILFYYCVFNRVCGAHLLSDAYCLDGRSVWKDNEEFIRSVVLPTL